jgi:hypothetical protein
MSKETLMKHLKTLGAFAMAALALLLLGASSASATALYSSGAIYTGELTATLEPGSSALFTTTGGTTLNTCTWGAVAGKVEEHGATKTAGGKITELLWGTPETPCTEPTVPVTLGSLEIHHITGTTNGTLTAKRSEWQVNTTIFGAECIYTFGEAIDLGTLNGSTSSNATIAINTVIKATNEFFCPDARWQANYKFTTPSNLYVEAS